MAPTHPPPLSAYRLPRTAADARTYLRGLLLHPLPLTALYPALFPAQAAASTAPATAPPDWPYTPRDVEFLLLVDCHLFPLAPWFLDALADLAPPTASADLLAASLAYLADLSAAIPLDLYGLDWADGAALRPAWVGLLLLLGELDQAEYLDYLAGDGALDPPLAAACAAAAPADPAALRAALARCRALPPPLDALPEALEVIWHNTGTVYLDATDEQPIDVTWCAGDLHWLAADYQDACAILQRVAPLLDWLEAAPDHWTPLLAAWTGAAPDLLSGAATAHQ